MAQYAFDQPWEEERQRLVLLEEAHDPVTIRQLEAVEVGKGWRCAEVGAGAGSIARWLAERVGATGRVIALDLDTRFLDAASYTNLRCAARTSCTTRSRRAPMTSSTPATCSCI